jgi:hypothetical protein
MSFKVAAISFVAGFAFAAWVDAGHGTGPPSRPAASPVSPAVSPKNPAETFRNVARVTVEENQCFVTASSKGRDFRALIDTGADGVYLDRATARLLGFNPARLALIARFGRRAARTARPGCACRNWMSPASSCAMSRPRCNTANLNIPLLASRS